MIESDDAGRSWKPISLLGKADFHVLRTAGSRIYGVNATDGELLVSDDGGRNWAARSAATPLLDIAAAPDDPDHVVAAGEGGLFVSRDAGRGWRPLSRDRVGLLAWPRPNELYLVDGGGGVHLSDDAGKAWRKVGDVGEAPAALAAHESELYVALHTNAVMRSSDGGRTWRVRVRP